MRAILLVVAIILFIIAAISNGDTAFNFLVLVLGLACVAGALVVEELGVGGRISAVGRRDV